MGPVMTKLTPEQVREAMEAGVLLIDLRSHAEFAKAYIPGSINLMFSRKSLPERMATAIPEGSPILLLSEEAHVAETAAEALQGTDRNPLKGIVAGGIEAWRAAGIALAKLPQLSVADLWNRLHAPHDDLVLIDVRESFEWDLGYIEGSLLIPLGEVWQRLEELERGKELILICEEGIRSSTAASILLHRGFTRAANVPGGFGDWFRANYPSVRPPKPPKR